jgi:hypothetical protein
MIEGRRVFAVICAVALTAFLGACGNPLEGGSEPSGSVIRVTDTTVDSGTQDLFFCEGQAVSYIVATVSLRNDDRPNFEDSPTTADGTASFVTMNRYRIDYAVLNMSATLPGIDGAGFSFGMDPGGTGDLTIFVITESVLEHIRSNYPEVGNGQAMEVRADITIWGQDAFQVDVSAQATATFTIDDFSPCTSDLPPADESSE